MPSLRGILKHNRKLPKSNQRNELDTNNNNKRVSFGEVQTHTFNKNRPGSSQEDNMMHLNQLNEYEHEHEHEHSFPNEIEPQNSNDESTLGNRFFPIIALMMALMTLLLLYKAYTKKRKGNESYYQETYPPRGFNSADPSKIRRTQMSPQREHLVAKNEKMDRRLEEVSMEMSDIIREVNNLKIMKKENEEKYNNLIKNQNNTEFKDGVIIHNPDDTSFGMLNESNFNRQLLSHAEKEEHSRLHHAFISKVDMEIDKLEKGYDHLEHERTTLEKFQGLSSME